MYSATLLNCFPGDSVVKTLPTNQCRRHRRHGFDPWVGKIPWRRKWQHTPVILPGESHGEEPGGIQSMGSQRAGHAERLSMHLDDLSPDVYFSFTKSGESL